MKDIHEKQLKFLEETANFVRQDVIKMLLAAGSGHSAGSLGMAEVFTALYFHILNHKPKQPAWKDRDRVVLSNGHICPVLYAVLARAGYFPAEELKTLRKLNSRLQGHPHRGSLPGIENTSGPLGSGLSQAVGMALAARMDNKKHRIYCLMSDGEHQEGNTWEGVMAAAKYRLSNLIAIIDRNYIQIDGCTEKVMPLDPLKAKYESFGWHALEINGHSFESIISAVAEAHVFHEQPTVVIAHTIPGRGVSFMENDFLWHGKPPKAEEARLALKELQNSGGRMESEHE
ncbi:MAG: transketolase [Candidatus Liptonbacteria bacterium]